MGPEIEALQIQRPFWFASPFGIAEFALLLWVRSQDVTPDEQMALSRAFVRAGCRYAVCGGHECSSWDDSVDYAVVIDELDGKRPAGR